MKNLSKQASRSSGSEAPHRCGVQPPVELFPGATTQDGDLDERDPNRRTVLEVTLARISEQFARLLRQALEGHHTR